MIAANLIPLPRREARRRLVRTHRWYLAWALTGAGLAAAVAVAAASWNTDTATPAAALAALEK
ncbi:MAG TPA: hypothetical protein VD963_00305, partial [Phycisphaerales bacterium]|nr:hypothetical protein [Phycisphaerales bacterium]